MEQLRTDKRRDGTKLVEVVEDMFITQGDLQKLEDYADRLFR